MGLTEHFSPDEFDRREHPAGACRRPGCRGFPRAAYPREWVDGRLLPLCQALERLRAALGGRSVHVNSGYRDPAYNVHLGGARFSQHMEGRAADIVVAGVPPEAVHDTALRMYNEGSLRIAGLGQYPNFTHIDVRVDPRTGQMARRLARWRGSRDQ